MLIPGSGEAFDLAAQIRHGITAPTVNGTSPDETEPPLEVVEPGREGRHVMNIESGVASAPGFYSATFVRTVIFGEAHVDVLRGARLDTPGGSSGTPDADAAACSA